MESAPPKTASSVRPKLIGLLVIAALMLAGIVVWSRSRQARFKAWKERLRVREVLVYDPRDGNDPKIDGPLITFLSSLSPPGYRASISFDKQATVLLSESSEYPAGFQIVVSALVSDENVELLRKAFPEARVFDRRSSRTP